MNSTESKNYRLLSELQLHMCMSISTDKRGLRLSYIPILRKQLTALLHKASEKGAEHVDEVITLLDAYHLTRDDQKSVDDLVVRSMAICAFLRIVINFQHLKLPGTEEPEPPVDSKTKAALTRAYNKKVRLMPYTNIAVNKSRRAAFVEAEGFVEEENEVKSGDDGDGADAMVIVKKPSKAAGTVAASVSSARGAGCGRGGKAK